jgi:hypothetical protein
VSAGGTGSCPSCHSWAALYAGRCRGRYDFARRHEPGPRGACRRDRPASTYDLGGNGESQILKTRGAVQVVQSPDGPIVGLYLVGDRVRELMGEAQIIYNWEVPPEQVAPFIHAHRPQNEALGEAMLALAGKPLHVHG